jgi:hypothetical protein
MRCLHEYDYARRIPRRMPEPPDRDGWEKQRESFGGELITLLEAPACDVCFGDEPVSGAIPGHAPNGSSVAPVPSRDISAGTSGRMSLARSIPPPARPARSFDRAALRHTGLPTLFGHHRPGSSRFAGQEGDAGSPRFSSLLEAMLASDPTLVHAISDAGLHGFPLE